MLRFGLGFFWLHSQSRFFFFLRNSKPLLLKVIWCDCAQSLRENSAAINPQFMTVVENKIVQK